jgi:hypothetical protein
LRLCYKIKHRFKGKIVNKPPLETSSVLIKLKRIPYKHKEKDYLELREENIKTIKELITINNEVRKA